MPSYSFKLNGQNVKVDAPADMPLLWVLRDLLGVTGPKYGCGVGVCRACTSHLDGDAFRPCITPVGDVVGREVTTIRDEHGVSVVRASVDPRNLRSIALLKRLGFYWLKRDGEDEIFVMHLPLAFRSNAGLLPADPFDGPVTLYDTITASAV